VAIASLIALLLLPATAALIASLIAALASAIVALLALRRLRGITGDVLGAMQQGAEIAFLFGVLAVAAAR
jgi:adenosylcobinamide-GDP ribazoletransferase